MPDKNDKLVEVKTILRSLLIAKANTTVTLKHLCKMYIEMEDCYIPFRDLGFSNLNDFLKSIVDTVTLYTNYAGELCVRHVDTEKSAHITSLVSRQSKPKKPTAKKKASYRPPYNYSPTYKSSSYSCNPSTNAYKKPFVDYYSKPTNNYNGTYNKYKPSNNYSTNTSSNYNSRSVNSYPTSTANNNNSKSMNHAASNSSNYSKPTNGISSMTAQSRRDPLNVLKMVLKDMKNAKITTGIRKVDVLTKVKFELCQAGRDPDDVYSMQHLNDHLDELWEEIELKEDYIYFRDELAIIKEQQRRSLNEKRPLLTTSRYDESPMIYSRQQEKQNNSFVKETPVSEDLNHETVEAMDTASQFSGYRQELKSTPMKAHSVSDDLINEKIRFRLQKLIEKHPEGIWCSELPNEYKKEYSIDLDYKDMGCTCIAEFVAKLPDIFEITKPLDNRLMVLNAKRPKHDFPNNFQKKTLASMYNIEVAKEPEPVPLQLTSDTSKTFFPSGVMKLNETVEIISVLTLSTMEYIEVNVSEIFTPSFFWVTLRENKKKFKAMMNELDDFYKYQDLDLYRIPQVILQTGLNIACIYAKIWHRGIIKKIKPDGFVVILFYDYGTVSTYHPSDIYFLHTRFSILPAQAIASGLCNTKPIGSIEWPRKSYEAFYDKVWNIPMIAVVSSINEENNTMMITLTDTSDDENDLHINDWMVENNFAEWGKMVCMKKNFAFEHYQRCQQINGLTLSTHGESIKNELVENNSLISKNYITHDSKISALQKCKSFYSCSSDCSSSLDETVYVYTGKVEDSKQARSEKLFNRCKDLMVKRIIDTSNIDGSDSNKKNNKNESCQQDCSTTYDDLRNSTQFNLTKEEREKSTVNNDGLTVHNKNSGNALDEIDSFHSINGGHGRMINIDWSIALRNDALLRSKLLFNRIKMLQISNNAYKEMKIASTKSSNLTTSSSNLNDTGSFHTASSVATLVQETIGYVKQTHTITQAILLNTPLNKLDDVSNSNVQDLRNERIENKAFGNSRFVSLETFNKPISSDSNDNLSTIKTHLSVKNNYSEIDSIRNEYRPSSQSSRNESDYEFHINQNGDARSVNRNSKNELEQELSIRKAKENGYVESHHDTNVCIKRRPSTHSASSYTEYGQSNDAELNGGDEYDDDKLKEGEDGTIFFERVIENGYKNPTINIKYPSNFAALHANKFENNADSTRVNSIKNIKPCDEIDEGYLTGSRRSQTNGSLSLNSNACDTPFVTSPTYIELQLSEKCDNKLIHIFHLENNGWVCMNEVVEAFTNYLDERAPRDEENKIVSDFVLTLITCKAMIQLLIDLDFIETKMVKEAIPLMRTLSNNTEDIIYKHFNNKILFDALNVTVQYGVFKRTQKISAK
ncbi:hypothetical protein TSAR_000904 [Trichomalopsis sarcophagae]|uniref:HTH OST-type domain-containing protein n=1 Tax=Trichomalopsis sarcophagae TaxID=543379 RepID=A0A232F2L6_9HYME|nr:hypothetical protein TSAR_000904 [Trichomalopsis sarcophagae]